MDMDGNDKTKISIWLASAIGVLYVFLTYLYQTVSLSGRVAQIIYFTGIYTGIIFACSSILSISVIFTRRHNKYFYVPALISFLTLIFLSISWFIIQPTEIRTANGRAQNFYSHTGIELPSGMNNIKSFDNTGDSIFGDGDAELSFTISNEELKKWMTQSGFNWKNGPYTKVGEVLNKYTSDGASEYIDGADVRYVIIDRTPVKLKRSPDDISNSTTVIVNESAGWVLVEDHQL